MKNINLKKQLMLLCLASMMMLSSCEGFTFTPAPEEEIPKQKFTITVVAADSTMGRVTGSGVYEEGQKVTIMAMANNGYRFVRWTDGNIDDPRTILVEADTTYTALFTGILSPIVSDTLYGHPCVDLGLPSGLKWATCNVGATKPEEYGDYFAWGETTPKSTYDWSTYKWCNGSSTTLTKYCTDSDYGTVDNKTVLDKEDDAAAVNMGGSWRMPTHTEIQELKNNCTTHKYYDEVREGVIVASKINGNHIFLPAAGYRYCGDLYGAGSYGHCWSSSLDTDYPYDAWDVSFHSDDVSGYSSSRYYGSSVRGVIE